MESRGAAPHVRLLLLQAGTVSPPLPGPIAHSAPCLPPQPPIQHCLWLPTACTGTPGPSAWTTEHLAHLAQAFASSLFFVILSYLLEYRLLWP